MEDVLKNTRATLAVTFSGGAADAASEEGESDVRVVATTADGTEITAAGGENTSADGTTEGRYTWPLPPQADVAEITVAWTGKWGGVEMTVETEVAVVGANLFTVSQLRAFNDAELNSETKYPTEVLIQKRSDIRRFFEDECGVSFVPCYRRVTLDGSGRRELLLPSRRVTKLLAAEVDGTALTAEELEDVVVVSRGELRRPSAWTADYQNVTVAYEHGYTTPPASIVEAALILARLTLVSRDISDRALSVSSDLGTVRLSVPGEKYRTGIPVVDSALIAYDAKAPLQA